MDKNILPFDPNGNIFRWGPVPTKFLFVSTFVKVHYKYFREKYGENWSQTLWMFKDGRSLWVNNVSEIEAAGEKVFLRYIVPVETRDAIYKEWMIHVEEGKRIMQRITQADAPKLSNDELSRVWRELFDNYTAFWTSGSVPELANYGSTRYLTKQLTQYIAGEKQLHDVLEALTAPTKPSFYQEEELALLRSANSTAHQQAFYWLKNSYAGTQVLPVEFFEGRKKEIALDLEEQIASKKLAVEKRKKQVQTQYALPDSIMNISEAITAALEWQDERKKYILIYLHCIDVLTREVATRFGYDFEELHSAWEDQVQAIIDGQDLHSTIKERAKACGVRFFHDCNDLNKEEVEFLWNTYGTDTVVKDLKQVKGIVASKGAGIAVEGKVKILLDPSRLEDFDDGEILLAPMTSPEYVFAMKKAIAVVTDTGGLTSHAAIVSRELGIPCIVGAKAATTVFKDGDIVLVEPTTGVVRKK